MRALGIALAVLGGVVLVTAVFVVSFIKAAKVPESNYLQIAGFVVLAIGYAIWWLTKPPKARSKAPAKRGP